MYRVYPFLVVIIVLICIYAYLKSTETFDSHPAEADPSSTTCSKKSCGALDDVNNPEYNIKQVIDNTLLIEQHLSDKRKYCRSCVLKHFRLNIAYLLEAITMSGVKKYPMLEESFEFNNTLFDYWYKNMYSDISRIKVLDSLRIWRRKMVDLYYFKNGDSDS